MLNSIVTFFDAHPAATAAVKVAVILLVTALLARLVRWLWLRNPKNQQFLFRRFVVNVLRAVILLAGIIAAIWQIPGLSGTAQTVLAGSGIVALALSLSAQESLGNVISGMFITMFRPFEVGDRVTLTSSGVTGLIEDITLRHTIIRTFTNTRVVVPNSVMNKEIVENSNLIDTRASTFVDVSVAYESDIDKAMAIMAEVIGSHPLFVDTRPEETRDSTPKVPVFVRELGASGVELRASMWTKTAGENFAACSDVRLQIKKAFDANGIEIPYTKYTILRQDSDPKE